MPPYDIENHRLVSLAESMASSVVILHALKSKPSTCESKNNHAVEEDRHEELTEQERRIIDGKYETFYQHDDFLQNVHTIINEISFEQTIITVEDERESASPPETDQKNENNRSSADCASIEDRPSTPLRTASAQTESKRIIQLKRVDRSIVQLLVHLLAKLVKDRKAQEKKCSLTEFMNVARERKDNGQIGDGTVHLARLLVKLESLSNECRVQIGEIVTKFEEDQRLPTVDSSRKDRAKAMQERMFENMTKKQRKVLSMSDDDEGTAIHLVFIVRPHYCFSESIENEEKNECCICQSSTTREPFGLVVRFCETGGHLPFFE